MLLPSLRHQVVLANQDLVRHGLVVSTFGNASAVDREHGLIVIKPSGVPYESLTPDQMVVTDLDGNTVEGILRPSSDLPTHAVLYRAFPTVGGVVHTHSRYATAWAQAGREIPCLGTTHADYVHGPIPVTDPMLPAEIESRYEHQTGDVIVRRFAGLDPLAVPAVLVAHHAPFCWGRTVDEAVHHAHLVEEIAHLAYLTMTLNPGVSPVCRSLHDKHFLRKHGPAAYYGQV